MSLPQHYNYFRDYDPAIGKYVESDPIGLKGGINSYAYVRSPLSETDPLGQMGGGGDVHPDTSACSYYQNICKTTGGACRYYCDTAPFMCGFGHNLPLFTGVSNRKLNCVRRCLVSEDAKAQSGHGFGAGPGGGGGSSSGAQCSGPRCQPDHVIDAYHRKCYTECNVATSRYPGVNPFGVPPDSFSNPNRGGPP